jgi:protease-4
MRTAWIDGITKGRKTVSVEAIEDGPFGPEDAKAKGLVDEIGYLDDARESAKKLAEVNRSVVRFGGSDAAPSGSGGVVEIFRSLSGSGHVGVPHVAVVRAAGGISMGGGSPLGGSGITERDLGRVIAKVTRDDSAKAVVLRIDSPGGSALASDLLWKRLMKLRAAKPIIVSVGGMAASGGYYLACTGTKIVAEPTSIVGSIGVVGGKLAVGRALDELGVHAETIAASPDPAKAARAAYTSPFVSWDDATRARMLTSMTAIYDLFVRRVAEGRGLPKEKVATFAEGRIFAGSIAKEKGMVDELGGLAKALELARNEAKLPKDAPVSIVGESPSLFDVLGEDDEGESEERGAISRAASEASARVVGGWLDLSPEIGQFLASAEPLVSGERTLAALPFVIMVR